MLITRQKQIPTHWIFYAQIPFVMAIAANMITGTPFIYSMKKFIDNPAAITFLLSVEVFVTMLGGPFASWLSDRIWTRYGRRKPFLIIADVGKLLVFPLIPFAPNIWVLICLKWAYGILHDIGSPKTALTMEIVPAKQRGKGAGFFNMQLQIVNLVFWGMVIGRFDDVYFTGPLLQSLHLTGEQLIYLIGALMFVFVLGFNCLGIKEIHPPDATRLREKAGPQEHLVLLFLRSFFKDVLSRKLLPLYLLLVVGTLTGVGLGSLAPLLYTDQWGYSLQQMGTNIAIGAIISIFIALGVGYVADAVSKIKVYTIAVVAGLLVKCVWTIYVYQKPGMRPELWEIIAFGQLAHTFGLVASTVSFPLILEYVTRNQLGTANAGMNLFDSTIRNGFGMFIGFYILLWSIFFLPQAGDVAELVFKAEQPREFVTAVLQQDPELAAADLDYRPRHRFGEESHSSQRWEIRRSYEEAADLHKQVKDLRNSIGKMRTRLQSPLISGDRAAELHARIASEQSTLDGIEQRLESSAAAFRERVEEAFTPHLFRDGAQILDLQAHPDGELQLTIEVVEKITAELETTFERNFNAVDLLLLRDADAIRVRPDLQVEGLAEPVHALQLRLRRDPAFVSFESALLAVGLAPRQAFNLSSELILLLRGVLGQVGAFEVRDSAADLVGNQIQLEVGLTLHGFALPSLDDLADSLQFSRQVDSATVSGELPDVGLSVIWNAEPQFAQALEQDAIDAAIRRHLPDAEAYTLAVMRGLYERVVAVAESAPTFLTVPRPVIKAAAADRQYDYFFSVQFFAIFTDFFALGVIALIVVLERRGKISRVGVTEDDNR